MSFGVSASDVLLCVQLAHKLWKGCRDAPAEFQAVSTEVASLHLVLNEAREIANDLSNSKEEDLRRLINGCKSVLQELEELLQRYKSLGTQSRRTWDRLRWGKGPVKDIRQRLISSTASLTSFNTSLTNAGLARVEKLLQQLVLDHQLGLREGSVISTDNLVSAEEGDEDVWRQIARELDDVGITSDLVREHRAYITDWIRMALETGELKEASPSADCGCGSGSGIEADVDYNSPSSSSPFLSMREIKHIREDSQVLDRSPYSGQSQGILSPMPIESSQEGIFHLYDVTLNVPQIGSYSCNICNYGGTFATWFEVLWHAGNCHGGSSVSSTYSPMMADLFKMRGSRDEDALRELNFIILSVTEAMKERLAPSNFLELMYGLYYSETCPFSGCHAVSVSPELNREHIRKHFSYCSHDGEETPSSKTKAHWTTPVFKLYVCETRGCCSSSKGFSNFRALEEHFREKHPGLDCKPLCPGAAAHGYYLSFSGRRLRDIWAWAESTIESVIRRMRDQGRAPAGAGALEGDEEGTQSDYEEEEDYDNEEGSEEGEYDDDTEEEALQQAQVGSLPYNFGQVPPPPPSSQAQINGKINVGGQQLAQTDDV